MHCIKIFLQSDVKKARQEKLWKNMVDVMKEYCVQKKLMKFGFVKHIFAEV